MTLPFMPGLLNFVVFVENTLGWLPEVSDSRPRWKVRSNEATKLKKKIATDPTLYSWENLALTVEYLRAQHKSVSTPVSVCWWVKEALERAYQPKLVINVQQAINDAIAWESTSQSSNWEYWVGRMTRAGWGDGQRDVLAEWHNTGRAW